MKTLHSVLVIVFLATLLPQSAGAIPAFARKYRVSCSLCHGPAPRLTAFGEQFAGNGFEMQPGEEPRDTIDTGDPSLRLLDRIDVALRLDMFLDSRLPFDQDEPTLDLQTPYNIKLLSGGVLSEKISYYMYFFLSERGEVAGLEDAYVQFTDVAGSGISLIAGQFQVSDPLFKRELRLQYDDYQAYRIRVGAARSDLTYDRGLFASFSPWANADAAVIVVNGSGITAADEDRQYDTDALKNVALRLSQEVGPVRVGGFAYFGEQRSEGFADRIRVFGPDASITAGNVSVNGQYLRRTDTNPFFALAGAETEVNSAFGEVVWSPDGSGGRWHFAALYNWIDSDDAIFTLRAGEETALSRFESISGSLHYLLRRNVRLLADVGRDLETNDNRLTIGVFVAW